MCPLTHSGVVIRRAQAVEIVRRQLVDAKGRRRFDDPTDNRVAMCSTTVDCAANRRLVQETAEIAKVILKLTHWQMRFLSKSTLLTCLADQIPEEYHRRCIYGFSTGTDDDKEAAAIEQGTPPPSKRIETLHKLQDRGLRTFGMVCPSLPQANYPQFARDMAAALRIERCEHVWAEVINLRGRSFTRTINALTGAGLTAQASDLRRVCGPGSSPVWEAYARATFEAHAAVVPPDKLKFLQYVTPETAPWWAAQKARGAVPLGINAKA